jgi:hypothetical protein
VGLGPPTVVRLEGALAHVTTPDSRRAGRDSRRCPYSGYASEAPGSTRASGRCPAGPGAYPMSLSRGPRERADPVGTTPTGDAPFYTAGWCPDRSGRSGRPHRPSTGRGRGTAAAPWTRQPSTAREDHPVGWAPNAPIGAKVPSGGSASKGLPCRRHAGCGVMSIHRLWTTMWRTGAPRHRSTRVPTRRSGGRDPRRGP